MNNHSFRPAPVVIKTEHLTKLYTDGQVSALVDVSLEIRKGEYVAIMGPSGSGKSTLLNMLGVLDAPTSGEIFFESQPISKVRNLEQFCAWNIGFVFQSFYLIATLSALENIQVPMFEGTLKLPDRVRRAKELLEIVGLGHRIHHQPQQLSVGERQRVAIARALANDPVILMADEPTGNLDSKSANGVFDLFARLHRERGMTIILITHDDDLGRRAERIVRMQDGRMKSDTRSPGPAGGNGSGSGGPGCGSGVRGPVRHKSVLPPFAVHER